MLAENKYGIGLLLMFVCTILGIANAKSVYVINDTEESELQAYKIEGTNLTYQSGYTCIFDPPGGTGAVGLALDESEYGAFLFVTFEDKNEIELVNAKTMEYLDIVEAPDPYGNLNLAGTVVDKSRRKLYVIDRQTNNLYVYSWDAENRELTLDYPDPYYVELEECYQGYGLALDEENSRLYVGDNSKTVKYYDVNDVNWGKVNEFTITDKAIGIAIDVENQYVYTGSSQFGGSNYLTKYDLSTSTETREYIGSPVLGISVDQESSLVYITTFGTGNYGTWDELMVYDSDLTLQSSTDDIGNPAGVVVGDVGYIPPFGPNKIDNIEDCVPPQMGEITYTITVDYQWAELGYSDPNIFDSIKVVDFLPREVDFVSASDNGEVNGRIVTWEIDTNTLEPNSVDLTVQINRRVPPGGKIENIVKVKASLDDQEHIGSYKIETDVCNCTGYGKIIYVDITAEGNNDGSTWEDAYMGLQSGLAESWPCDEIWVAKSENAYKPTDDPCDTEATFQMVSGVGVYGGFVGGQEGEEHRYERNWFENETILSGIIDSAENEPNCVNYVVVSDANAPVSALDGFTVTGCGIAGVYCEDSSPIIQHNKITDSGTGIYCLESEQPVIKNNWLYKNDYGLHFESPTDVAVVRNNTIANNNEMGIYLSDGVEPEISNCILAGNPEDSDLIGCSATYSYIESPATGEGNIDGEPNFPPFVVGEDDYHLDPCSGSACIDAGDPCSNYWGERDIDKHFRVLDGGVTGKIVDMGADEYCNETSSNEADFSGDGIVNYIDFAIFAKAWLSEQGDGNWNVYCDLVADQIIDIDDLKAFAQEWLWMSCDGMKGIGMMEMMMGMGGGMGKMAGGESMLTAETAESATSQETQSEPSVEEQIEQIKQNIAVLYEIKDQVEDKEACLGMVTSLEEMLKGLEDSQ